MSESSAFDARVDIISAENVKIYYINFIIKKLFKITVVSIN